MLPHLHVSILNGNIPQPYCARYDLCFLLGNITSLLNLIKYNDSVFLIGIIFSPYMNLFIYYLLEVLLAIECCGICGTDIHMWTQGKCGDFIIKDLGGVVMGHESSGTVIATANDVTSLKIGMVVSSSDTFGHVHLEESEAEQILSQIEGPGGVIEEGEDSIHQSSRQHHILC